jgi:biopolymer transport protein ExbD
MNLAQHDPETDMEMNMTPMIDVVFLLIIFFMVITDMTQQDLEDLQLPVAVNAIPDKPKPDEFRPVVNITIDGKMYVKRRQYYDPEDPDDYKQIKEWLSDVADRMKKEPGTDLPDEPLLIRADQYTPFKEVQKLMEQCGYKGIQIWKVQFAAAEADPNDPTKRKVQRK